MAKVAIKNGVTYINCPGCEETHSLNTDPKSGKPCWKFNGDMERPTFSPSILVRTGHYVPGQPQPPNCKACNYVDDDGDPWPFPCGVCHSFVKDGKIQFLNDCTHKLAGKTVELENIDAA